MNACTGGSPTSGKDFEIQTERSGLYGYMVEFARGLAGNQPASFNVQFRRKIDPVDLIAKPNNVANDEDGRRLDRIDFMHDISKSSGSAILYEVGSARY